MHSVFFVPKFFKTIFPFLIITDYILASEILEKD